jgi:hypothetical protein
VVGAAASHPTQICIDAEPDRSHPTSNDDEAETLAVGVGATDDGHPPEQEGCVIQGQEGQVQLDFEITGVADPDSSDTPETPDMTCTTRDGTAFCSVIPPSSAGGEQTIAAWIDFDLDDSTVELDREEGVDDADTDATDVALWTWSHGDPCFASACVEISISYDKSRQSFSGRVFSEKQECISRREVIVKKIRKQKRIVLGSTITNRRGRWRFGHAHARGKFYAIAKRVRLGDEGCKGLHSVTIRVR